MTATPLCNSSLCFLPLSDMKQAPLVSLLLRCAQFVFAELLPVWALLLAQLSLLTFFHRKCMWQNSYTHPIRSCPILRVTSLSQGIWANDKRNLDWTSPCICQHTAHQYMPIYFIPPLYYYFFIAIVQIFPGDIKDTAVSFHEILHLQVDRDTFHSSMTSKAMGFLEIKNPNACHSH